ncbi:MAG: two-component system sensor histidine kinase NtrB [Terriglobales bacterium]
MRFWHTTGVVLAVIAISLTSTLLLVWAQPDRTVTLLVCLPGIVIVEALFGGRAGVASVLLSVVGSTAYRVWFLPSHMPLRAPSPLETFEEHLILLVVGMFIVALMELRRRSGQREQSGAQQLEAVLANVGDAVVVFARDFRLLSMNAAAHALLDRPGESLVGQHAEVLERRFPFTPDAPSATPSPPSLEAASRAGIAVHEQGTILDVGRDRRIQVMVHALPWRTAAGELQGAVVVITDLTALKALQLRLVESARLAALGKMFSGLSHDFNHVLDIVRRALAVLELQENAPAEERRRYRAMIDRAAVDGNQIVRRLRNYIAGSGAREPVDLALEVGEAIELTHPLWRSRPRLEVVAELHPVPAILGQRYDLQRVLVNLLFNAIEAIGTAPGRIVVHTESDDHSVRAWVEDSGPGIAPEVLARLFQAYVTTKPQGMGMGLFSAGEIARDHAGKLTVTSTPGVATRFTLELPRASPGALE